MQITTIRHLVQTGLERIQCHPFVRHAAEGTASLEQIERWLFCAGRESRSFPVVIEGILSWHQNAMVRSVLSENLADEYGNGDPQEAHFRHYLKLIGELGFSDTEFFAYRELLGISVALETAVHVAANGNEGEAIGYLLVNEAMTPTIYSAIEKWLKQHRPSLRTKFFSLHISTDEHHVAMLDSAIESMSPELLNGVADGIALGERAMAVLLDEAHGCFQPSLASDAIRARMSAVR